MLLLNNRIYFDYRYACVCERNIAPLLFST